MNQTQQTIEEAIAAVPEEIVELAVVASKARRTFENDKAQKMGRKSYGYTNLKTWKAYLEASAPLRTACQGNTDLLQAAAWAANRRLQGV